MFQSLFFIKVSKAWGALRTYQTCKIERFTKILIAKNRELFLQKVSS